MIDIEAGERAGSEDDLRPNLSDRRRSGHWPDLCAVFVTAGGI